MSETLFGSIAADYARFRPRYPDALFDELAALAPSRALAWDCATGTGQAAGALARRFERVLATDVSAKMIAQAPATPGVEYRAVDSCDSGIASHSIDLITVANALHWFHGEAFEREARRVLAPGGVVAAWSYKYPHVAPAIDALVRHLHDVVIDPFWAEPNRVVEREYRDLWFPFDRVAAGPHVCAARLTADAFLGYLATWSAAVKYAAHHGRDPLAEIRDELLAEWGGASVEREVRWPLTLVVGRA